MLGWGRKRSRLHLWSLQSLFTLLPSPRPSHPLCASLALVNVHNRALKLGIRENYPVSPVLPVPCLHPACIPYPVCIPYPACIPLPSLQGRAGA